MIGLFHKLLIRGDFKEMLKSTNHMLTGIHILPEHSCRIPPINTLVPIRGHVCKKISFHNGTYYDITVVDRQGCAMVCRKDGYGSTHKFTVETTYIVDSGTLADFISHLKSAAEKGNPDLELIIKTAENTMSVKGYGAKSITVQHSIHEDKLQASQNGSCYVTNIDLVISLFPPAQVPPHPHSMTDRYHSFDVRDPNMSADKFGAFLKIEIVDNDGVFGTRYINVGHAVLMVRPIKDPQRGSGVYRYASLENKHTDPLSYIHCKVYEFDEADASLGLHRTREDAEWAFRDSSEEEKKKLHELQADIQRRKLEQSMRDEELARQRSEMEAENAKAKHAYEQLKMDNDRIRTQMETKNQAYKTTSDNFKMILAIITGSITLGTIIWKAAAMVQSGK